VGENPSLRSIWWKRADWFVFVPWFLVLASFWIYLAGPTSGPVAEAIHEFQIVLQNDLGNFDAIVALRRLMSTSTP